MAITYTPLAYFRSVYQETHAQRMEQALADARAEAATTADAATSQVKLYQSLIEGELRIAKELADAAKGPAGATTGQWLSALVQTEQMNSRERMKAADLQIRVREEAARALDLTDAERAGIYSEAGKLGRGLVILATDPRLVAADIADSPVIAKIQALPEGQRAEALATAFEELTSTGIAPDVARAGLAAGVGVAASAVRTLDEHRAARAQAVGTAVAPGVGGGGPGTMRDRLAQKAAEVALGDGGAVSTSAEPSPELAASLARIAEYRRLAEEAVAGASPRASDVYRRAGELYAPVAPSRIPAAAQSTRPLPSAAQAQRAAETGRPIPPPRNVADILAARSLSAERVGQGYAPVAPPRTAAPVSTQAAATARAMKAAAALTTSGAWQAPPAPVRPVVEGVVAEVELGRVKPAEVYGTLVRDLGEDGAEEAYGYVIAALRNKARAPKVAPVTPAPRGAVSTTGADVGE